jgi:type II secretory pathway pseudopilin PulG
VIFSIMKPIAFYAGLIWVVFQTSVLANLVSPQPTVISAPTLSFAPHESLAFDWQTLLKNKVKIDLRNDSLQIQTVKLSVEFPDGPKILAIDSTTVDLATGGMKRLQLISQSKIRPDAGVYSGVLTALSNTAIVRIGLQLTVPASDLQSSPVDAWSITSYRFAPSFLCSLQGERFDTTDECLNSAVVPLAGPTPEFPSATKTILVSNLGRMAEAQWSTKDKSVLPSLEGAQVSFERLYLPGTYSGEVADILGPSKKPLKLTVNVKDSFWTAVVFLVVGILIALLAPRFIQYLATRFTLLSRAKRLTQAINTAQTQFTKGAAGQTWSSFNITIDFNQRQKSLLKMLGWRAPKILEANLLEILPETAKKGSRASQIEAALVQLETTVAAWSKLNQSLNTLQNTLNKNFRIKSPTDPPSPSVGNAPITEPLIKAILDKLLVNNPMTVLDFQKRQLDLATAIKLADGWKDLDVTTVLLRGWAGELQAKIRAVPPPLTTDQENVLNQAVDTINGVHYQLWYETDIDRLALPDMLARLESAGLILAGLNERFAGVPGLAAANTLPIPLNFRVIASQVAATIGIGSGADFDARRDAIQSFFFAWGRIAVDGIVVLAALIFAIYTGMLQLYADKPYGEFRDYVATVVWGFGTKIITDGVAGVLGSVPSLRPTTSPGAT